MDLGLGSEIIKDFLSYNHIDYFKGKVRVVFVCKYYINEKLEFNSEHEVFFDLML